MKFIVNTKYLLLALVIFLTVLILGMLVTVRNETPFPYAKITSDKKIYKAYEIPTFKLKLNEKQKASVIKSVFADEEPSVKAEFINSTDEKTRIIAFVSKEDDQTYSISPSQTNSFKPGKYTLSATIETQTGTRNLTQDFTWGVLALNPNKAVYYPNETAKIAIGVLDDKGEMVCNADVTLSVTRPDGIKIEKKTSNNSIKVTNQCHSKEESIVPDYETQIELLDEGTYILDLVAITKNGTHQIRDNIKVSKNIDFDIERSSATRLYPKNQYPMTINITANKDYKGTVQEIIPQGFAIIKSKMDNKTTDYAAKIIEKENMRIIKWDVDWKKGEEHILSYVYDAPDISPEFYLIGNLELEKGFKEDRFWQIASDAIVAFQSLTSVINTTATTSVTVPVPANTAVGDLLIAQIVSNGTAITALSGWTDIAVSSVVTNPRVRVQYRIADGTEGSSQTWTIGSAANTGIMARFTGNDTTTPIDVVATEWDSTSLVTNIVIPAQTTVTNQTMLVAGCAANSSTATFTQPSTQGGQWTEDFDSGSGKASCFSHQPVLFSTGDTGTMTIVVSANRASYGWMAAVRPAATSTINVSGNVYNAGTTTASSACDANAGTNELSLRTNGTTYNASCSNSDGSYTFTSVAAGSAGSGMITWINDLSTDGAIAIRYDGTGDSTLNTFYNDTVTVTSDDTNGVTNAIMNTYDADTGDVDIPYVVTSNNLTASSGAELLVKLKSGVANGSTVYAPGGTVTTNATGGDFHIDDNSAASLDSATSSIGRDILIDTGATLAISASATVGGGDITATGTLTTSGTPTVTIRGTGSISGVGTKTIYNLTVGDGTTATTTLSGALTVSNDASVGTGSTFSINANLTVTGSLTNTTTGVINHTANSPIVTVSGSSIGGGSGNITFYRLQKAGAGTTTFSGSGTNTINNTLDATAGTLTLSNDITVTGNASASTGATLNQNANLTINGGNLLTTGTGAVNTTAGTGTVTITGTGNIGGGGAVTVYALAINGSQTAASTITANNSINVGSSGTFILAGQNINSGGNFTNTTTGVITCSGTSGTVTLTAGGTLGSGNGSITFCNLATSTTGTTNFSGAGTNTVNNNISVGAGTTLNINSSVSVAGSLTNTTSGVIGTSAGTPTLTMTGTGTIGGGTTGAITFYNLSTTGTGTYTFTNGGTNTINNNISVGASTTLNLNSSITVAGSLTNTTSGIISYSSGTPTLTIQGASLGGGSGTITFYNLTKSGAGTTTFSGSSTNIINNSLTVSAGTLTISNSLTVGSTTANSGGISNSATLNYSGTPTITIKSSSAGAATIGGSGTTTFYNLSFLPAVASAPTFTLGNAASQTITIDNDLTIGDGTNAVIVTANTNNPLIDINGSLTIAANATFTAPPSATFTIAKNMTNNGTFNNNSGTVTFDTSNSSTFNGSGTPAIQLHNFSSTTASKTLIFTAAKTFRIDGLFTVSGTGSNIQSTSGTQWLVNLQGTSSITNTTITNSGCSGSLDINLNATNTDGTNNGTCWVFAGGGPTVINSKVQGNTRIGGNVRIQ